MGRRDGCPTPLSLGHSEKLSGSVQGALWGAAASPSPLQPAQRDGSETGRGCAAMGMGFGWQQGLNR